MAQGFHLDRMSLRKRLLHLSRHLHPDVHGTADDATRDLAQRKTAELNAAFQILEDDFRRASWLVRSLGGPTEETEPQMPQAFLTEVLEWNEAVEEARTSEPGSTESARLAGLEDELRSERKKLMDGVAAKLTPLPELGSPELVEVRHKLNALRYLDRTLCQLEELRLKQANSPS
jgi:molecular chaperone HscB